MKMEIKGNILMKKYEVGKLLGQGTFAKVYHGRDLKAGQNVAIKVINKEKVQKIGLIEQTKREISVMRLVRHPNVVHLYEVMATKTKIYLIMEYAKGGELFQKVAKGRLKEVFARRYFQQLVRAVEFCHSRGVYHRDLKPENLLLDDKGVLKVSDFGLSALAESGKEDGLLHTICGTPSFVAPEVISKKGYDGAKADVWSCGVILFVLLSGQLPFNGKNLMELYRKISEAEYKCPEWFPEEARSLLSRILDPNPCTRISIAEIMRNPWFRKGLGPKPTRSKVEDTEKAVVYSDDVFTTNENLTDPVSSEGKQDVAKPANLNAFDIISLSTGLDLSGLFVRNDQKDEVQFTSACPASAIISQLENIAAHLKLKVNRKEDGLIKLEKFNAARYGILSIDVELFQFSAPFHLVMLRKSQGNTMVYQKLLQEGIRPALKEVVWAWHGEQQQPPPQGR